MHVLYQEQTCSTLKQLSSFKGIIPFCWSTFQIYWDSIYNEYFALLIGPATLKSHDQRCYLSFQLNTAKTTPEATLRTRIISTKVAELPLAMNPLCQTRKFRLWNKNLLLCLEKMWLRNITLIQKLFWRLSLARDIVLLTWKSLSFFKAPVILDSV